MELSFLAKTEPLFLEKWQWLDAYLSENDESSSENSTMPFFVLTAEVRDHC